MRFQCRLLAALFVLVLQFAVHAGGPILIGKGSPQKWLDLPICYRIDRGSLGAIPENDLVDLVKKSLRVWESVDSAKVSSKFMGKLTFDVDELSQFDLLLANNSFGNLVLFDNAGTIIEELFGSGQREYFQALTTTRVEGKKNVTRFCILLNGFLVGQPKAALSTLAHEYGHVLGLDHCQINADVQHNGTPKMDKIFPLMLPKAKRLNATLHPDDEAWLSHLYPSNLFMQRYGFITGIISRKNGAPILGANVRAVKIESLNEKLVESDLYQYSCVSDFLANQSGEFEIPVAPGKYILVVEAIKNTFCGPSSVGPYAKDTMSESFVRPVKRTRFDNFMAGYSVKAGNKNLIGTLSVD